MVFDDLISILIPAYNSERFIIQAIESARQQSYKNIEIIISDNDSNDNTFKICEGFEKIDSRVICYKAQSNIGMVNNWNKALSKAQGKYCILLCSDDWLNPTILEKYISIISNNNSDDVVLFSNSFVFDEVLNTQSSYNSPFVQGYINPLRLIWKLHGVPLSSVLFKRMDGVMFNTELKFNCDLEYFLRLTLIYRQRLYYSAFEGVNVKIHERNETKLYDLSIESLKLLSVLRKSEISLIVKLVLFVKKMRLKYA